MRSPETFHRPQIGAGGGIVLRRRHRHRIRRLRKRDRSQAREAAALQAKFSERLKAENAATARALEERARADREASGVRAVETHAESEAAFAKYLSERPSMTLAEESIATELGVTRIRSRLPDPDAVEN